MSKVAPAAKKPVAPKSAAPGTVDETAKKVVKIEYPGLVDAEGNEVRLTAIPKDFDHKTMKPLGRKDFADESLWFEMQAERCEAKAKHYRQAAADFKKLGNVKDRAKAKKLVQMQRRFDELKAQLASQGIDVASLLAADDSTEE